MKRGFATSGPGGGVGGRRGVGDRRVGAGRRGATLVEAALVLPIFILLLFAVVEANHALMVKTVLRSAAEQGSRFGISDGVTTAEVKNRVRQIVGNTVKPGTLTVYVKNGSVFDGASNPESVNVAALPDVELANCEPWQLYVVRCEVNFRDVSLVPSLYAPGGTNGFRVAGQSIMRHE